MVGQQQVKLALSVGVYKHLVAMKHSHNRQQSVSSHTNPGMSPVNDALLDRRTLDGYGLHDSQKQHAIDAAKAATIKPAVVRHPPQVPPHLSSSASENQQGGNQCPENDNSEGPSRPVSIRLGSGKVVQYQGIAKTNILLLGSTGAVRSVQAHNETHIHQYTNAP